MKKFLMVIGCVLTGFYGNAQLSDTEKIVGTWQLDSVAMDDISLEDLELLEEMKSVIFFTFASDSTVAMPDFESDYDGEGDAPTLKSLYYVKDGKLYIEVDDEFIDYEFINDNYLLLKGEEESVFFKRE